MNSTERAVGRYQIDGELGRGGMAVVYLARQLDLDRLVALKELALGPTADTSLAKRFLREARLVGSLSHPNIVTVHEYFEHAGTPYIAMEYMERGALRRYVGRLSLAQIGAVLEAALAGIGYAAGRQIVHRDIKPENIMINAEGRAKIADFGIATATNAVRSAASMTAPGTAVGTPNYMAPEQATAQRVGPATDLYAIGIVAFELFAGRPPFADTDDPLGVLMRPVSDPIPP
jgi:serine/threonine protein kinase